VIAIGIAVGTGDAAAQIRLPPVQVGPVSVGPVSVGPVQVGPVQVPEVQVPEVRVPEVRVPEVRVPEVEVPDVPVPTPPPTPRVPVPDVPAPARPGGDGGGGGGGGGGAPSGGGGGGSGGGGTTASSSGEGSRPATSSGSVPRSTPASPRADDSGSDRAAARPEQRRATLRGTVERLSGCLDSLGSAERRVLVLRSGLGAGPARTRRGVARVLDVRVQRVRRLERSGLRHVRAVARTDGCGGSVTETQPVSGSDVADDEIVTLATVTPAGEDPAPESSGSTGGGGQGDVRSEAASRPVFPGFIPNPVDGGVGLVLAIVLVALAAAAGFATPSIRDRLRRG
jgi:Sigma-70, region 4